MCRIEFCEGTAPISGQFVRKETRAQELNSRTDLNVSHCGDSRVQTQTLRADGFPVSLSTVECWQVVLRTYLSDEIRRYSSKTSSSEYPQHLMEELNRFTSASSDKQRRKLDTRVVSKQSMHSCGTMNHSNETGGNSSSSKKQKSDSSSSSSGGQGSSSTSCPGRPLLGSLDGGSGGSDSDDNDDDDRKRRPPRNSKKEPKSKIIFLDEDDEATDSADEGDEGKEESDRTLGNALREKFDTRQQSTITVVESGTSGSSPPQIGSPVNMAVGYGATDTMAPRVIDNETPQSPMDGTPTLDSPRPLVDLTTEHAPPMGLPMMSPGMTLISQNTNTVLPSTSSNTTGVPIGSVQPSPSIPGASFKLPFETTWGWQPPMYSPFPLTSSHPGSIANTPVPTDPGAFLKPGAPVYLHGTVCQESDGVLVVSVRWRNRTFSGSLIDIGQHEWAPPRLSCGFSEPAMKLNDLYSKQEAENQPVNVDVEDDDTKESSEMAGIDTKSDATESATEQGPDLEGEFEEVGPSKEIVAMEMDKAPPPKPEEPEAMESKPSSRRQSLTLLPKPSQQSENHFSDISDASDGETEAQEDREPPSSQSQAPSSSLLPLQQSLLIQARPVNGMIPMPTMGGEDQKKPLSEQKMVKTHAQLPTFASIPSRSPRERREKGEWRKPESKHSLEDVIDSQPSTPKDHSQQMDSSLRVISSYPINGTPPGVTVTSPGQDHRHSFAQSKRSNSPLPGNKPGSVISSSSEYSPFKTLVNVAASKEYMASSEITIKKEMPHRHQGKTNTNFSMRVLTGEESKKSSKETKSDPKYVSSRPSSLTPDSKHAHRSPSPTTMRYPFTEQQAASLPPFEASPVPTIVKPHHSATLGYGPPGIDPISLSHGKEEAHDSDSSGSGSILSTHIRKKKTGSRKKRAAQPLIGVKDSKVPKEESGLRQPETPALAPMPFTAFNVKIQPISPGIDTPLHQQQQQLRKESPSGNMPHLPPPPEISTKKMKVSSPKPKQPTVGEYMENLPSLRGITASSEPGNHHHHIMPNSITQTLAKDSKSTAISSPSSAFTAASVSHKLGEGLPLTTMVPGPAGINPGAKQPDALPFAYTMHQQHTKLQQGGSSSITPAVIQTAVNDSSQMESKTHSPSGGSGAGRRPRKRKSAQDILMEPSKRSPPTHARERERDVEEIMDHRPPPPPPPSLFLSSNKQQLPKQIVGSFMSNEENKEKDKVKRENLPPGFEYDPHLPMSMQYQLIAFENQQKQAQLRKFHEEYQLHLNEQRAKQEEFDKEAARMKSLPQAVPRHNHRAPKKQKSSEMLNLPRAHSPNQMMFPRNMSPTTPPEGKPPHGHRHSHIGVHSQAQPIIIPGPEKPHSIHQHHYSVLGPVKSEHQDHMKHVHKLSSPTSSKAPVFQNHTPTIQHHSKLPPRQDVSRKQPTLKKPEQHHIKMEEHVPPMWPGVQMISGPAHFHPHHHPSHSHSQLSIATTSPTVATIPIQTHSSGHFLWPTVSMNPGSFSAKLSEKNSRPETSAPMGVITKPHGSGNDLLPPRNPSHMRRSPSPIQKKSPSHATEWPKPPPFMVSPISTAAPSHHHHHPKPQVSQSERRRESVPRPFPGGQQAENKPRSIHQPHLHQHQHHGPTSVSSHGSSSQAHKTHKPPEQSMGIQPQVHVALPQVSTIQQPSLSPNAAAAAQMKPQLVAGIPPNINPAMAEEWMKQMQMMQQLTTMGPEAVAAWQQQMAAIAAAQMGVAGMQVDPNVILALQQQQQNEAMAANLQAAAMAQNMNMIQFMHPTAMVPHPLGPGLYAADPNVLAASGIPFALHAQQPKRD